MRPGVGTDDERVTMSIGQILGQGSALRYIVPEEMYEHRKFYKE